jgi:NIMA (never in mitosis gene a)-related kinase 1/4/5
MSQLFLNKGLGYTQTGTPFYASPEIWKDQPYDYKSDIWSLGCVLYESICLRPPFRASNMEGLYKKVITGLYPNLSSRFSKELGHIIKAMLQVNPKKRPTAEKLLNSNIVLNKVEELFGETLAETKSVLLSTIRNTKNFMQLSDRLPEPKYQSNKFPKIDVTMDNEKLEYLLPKLFMNQNIKEVVNEAANVSILIKQNGNYL